jgi:hypothetical protein
MTRGNKGKLPPVVDLGFISRVSHYGNGSKRVAAGEGNSVEGFWLRVEGESPAASDGGSYNSQRKGGESAPVPSTKAKRSLFIIG